MQIRGASFDGRREQPQVNRIRSSGRTGITLQLVHQRIKLTDDGGCAFVAAAPEFVGSGKSVRHGVDALGLDALAANELIEVGARHDGACRPDTPLLFLRIELVGSDEIRGVDFVLR